MGPAIATKDISMPIDVATGVLVPAMVHGWGGLPVVEFGAVSFAAVQIDSVGRASSQKHDTLSRNEAHSGSIASLGRTRKSTNAQAWTQHQASESGR